MQDSNAPLWLPPELWPTLQQLAAELLRRQWRLVTAESCTGGLIAASCTSLSGSSDWFERSYVTYSNAAKTQDLGVPTGLLDTHGAVSEAVARAMVEGACARSPSPTGLSVTGIAGPPGATPGKPVGTVWFGWHLNGLTYSERMQFTGDRAAVRAATAHHALTRLLDHLRQG